jgi:hypothetical protein
MWTIDTDRRRVLGAQAAQSGPANAPVPGVAWIMKRNPAVLAMARESTRPLEPRLDRSAIDPRELDAPDLAELVARARGQTREHEASLACPAPPARRLEMPRFSGVPLADLDVQACSPLDPPVQPPRPLDVIAPLPPQARVLLGPGAMTMTLAIVATLAFGAFVVTS